MVGVVGSSPIAPTSSTSDGRRTARTERHGYDTANAQGSLPRERELARRLCTEKCGSSALFCFWSPPCPTITLPDGAVKAFDAPVTVAEVAAAIGPGLAKAALAGKVDGKLVDTRT